MIRFKTDFGSTPVVLSNLVRRGWEHIPTSALDDDWDLYWASVGSIKDIFGGDMRLGPLQRVNHFPNHTELTRKDLMVKNIRRMQRAAKKDHYTTPGGGGRGGGAGGYTAEELDIIPATFVLPQDYALFVEEYRKAPNSTWIMKPTSKSQGKGIFLINKLSQIKPWSSAAALPPAQRQSANGYIVSRYIDNPLLIGGKKFDMRLYVVVTSFKPLQVYMSTLGFCRFCSIRYVPGSEEMDNEFVHLTNVAIQKTGDDYNANHGNKWPMDNLRLYLEATRGSEATARLFKEIEGVIVKSLQACQGAIINDRHCFELYGYDVIIDDTLKPWLVEVNASPSLTTTTQADRLLKLKVINDCLNLVTPIEWLPMTKGTGAPPEQLPSFTRPSLSHPRPRVGSFRLIYHEGQEAAASVASAAVMGEGGEKQSMGWGAAEGAGGAGGGPLRPPSAASSSSRPMGGGSVQPGSAIRSSSRSRGFI